LVFIKRVRLRLLPTLHVAFLRQC
jgi:hypothetical protein